MSQIIKVQGNWVVIDVVMKMIQNDLKQKFTIVKLSSFTLRSLRMKGVLGPSIHGSPKFF